MESKMRLKREQKLLEVSSNIVGVMREHGGYEPEEVLTVMIAAIIMVHRESSYCEKSIEEAAEHIRREIIKMDERIYVRHQVVN
jgi:hypothetical protein